MDYLTMHTEEMEPIPFLPIVEIAGDSRVLIENHCGVVQFSTERIGVRVRYGEIQVCGCDLLLRHMTKNKLVITGQVQQLCLLRRG